MFYDDGEEMMPKWKLEVMLDERLSQEKDLLIRRVKALPKYGRSFEFKHDRLVRVNDVIEAIERSE